MPAPQQSKIPTYKETSNIPRPNVAYYMHDKRDSAGFQLAKLLGIATDELSEVHNKNKALQEKQDIEVKTAHAQLGLKDINRATASNTFDLVTGDFKPDAYDMKQGQLDAATYAGEIRDMYMGEEVFNMTDPSEFNQWLDGKIKGKIEDARARGPSFYNGFVTELGSNVELLTKQYAGRTQKVIANRNATAFKSKLRLAAEADAATSRSGELGQWLKGFLTSESAGNWNAWFGNSGNTEDLSKLTLREIRRRQARPGNDAAGLIQIVPSTLDGMIKKYGYTEDMKFTPQVQTEMALYLMKEKGLDKWLRGEMSDTVFANKVAGIWAGLKTSSGKGRYDGDGVNKATESHSVTVSRLAELRYLMERNPQLKKLMTKKEKPAAGDAIEVIGKSSDTNVSKLLTSETETGVSNKEARDHYTEMLVESIQSEADVSLEDTDLQERMTAQKLNSEQRDRVLSAAEQRRKRDEISSREMKQKSLQTSLEAVLSGKPEELDGLLAKEPKWYAVILDRMAEQDTEDTEERSEEFLKNLDYSRKDVPQRAFRAYLEGDLTQQALSEAVSQHKLKQTSDAVIRVPAVRDYIQSVKRSLPQIAQGPFDQLVSAGLNDLIEQNEGKRPSVASIIETVDRLAQAATQRKEAEQQALLSRYPFQGNE